MLEYNGYSFKSENNLFVFRHSGFDGIGLGIIIALTVALIVLLIMTLPLYGIGALLLAILIFGPIVKRNKGRSKLEIDANKEVLRINEVDQKIEKNFNEIASVYTHSKFVDEYSSAFKSTSKEYRVTIGLEIDNRKFPLFKLIADHEKPSKEAAAVHDFLERVIGAR